MLRIRSHRFASGLCAGLCIASLLVPAGARAARPRLVGPAFFQGPEQLADLLARARAAYEAKQYMQAIDGYEEVRRALAGDRSALELRLRADFGLASANIGAYDETERMVYLDRAWQILIDLRNRLDSDYPDRAVSLRTQVERHLGSIEQRRRPGGAPVGDTPVAQPPPRPLPAETQQYQAPPPPVAQRRSDILSAEGRDMIHRGRALTAVGGSTMALAPAGLLVFMIAGITRSVTRARLVSGNYDNYDDYLEVVRRHNNSGKVAFSALVVAGSILPVSISLLAAGSSLRRRGRTMYLSVDPGARQMSWGMRF